MPARRSPRFWEDDLRSGLQHFNKGHNTAIDVNAVVDAYLQAQRTHPAPQLRRRRRRQPIQALAAPAGPQLVLPALQDAPQPAQALPALPMIDGDDEVRARQHNNEQIEDQNADDSSSSSSNNNTDNGDEHHNNLSTSSEDIQLAHDLDEPPSSASQDVRMDEGGGDMASATLVVDELELASFRDGTQEATLVDAADRSQGMFHGDKFGLLDVAHARLSSMIREKATGHPIEEPTLAQGLLSPQVLRVTTTDKPAEHGPAEVVDMEVDGMAELEDSTVEWPEVEVVDMGAAVNRAAQSGSPDVTAVNGVVGLYMIDGGEPVVVQPDVAAVVAELSSSQEPMEENEPATQSPAVGVISEEPQVTERPSTPSAADQILSIVTPLVPRVPERRVSTRLARHAARLAEQEARRAEQEAQDALLGQQQAQEAVEDDGEVQVASGLIDGVLKSWGTEEADAFLHRSRRAFGPDDLLALRSEANKVVVRAEPTRKEWLSVRILEPITRTALTSDILNTRSLNYADLVVLYAIFSPIVDLAKSRRDHVIRLAEAAAEAIRAMDDKMSGPGPLPAVMIVEGAWELCGNLGVRHAFAGHSKRVIQAIHSLPSLPVDSVPCQTVVMPQVPADDHDEEEEIASTAVKLGKRKRCETTQSGTSKKAKTAEVSACAASSSAETSVVLSHIDIQSSTPAPHAELVASASGTSPTAERGSTSVVRQVAEMGTVFCHPEPLLDVGKNERLLREAKDSVFTVLRQWNRPRGPHGREVEAAEANASMTALLALSDVNLTATAARSGTAAIMLKQFTDKMKALSTLDPREGSRTSRGLLHGIQKRGSDVLAKLRSDASS